MDSLWSNIQEKMEDFINKNGGQASLNIPIKARPKWQLVEQYLRGKITFTSLKQSLGCY